MTKKRANYENGADELELAIERHYGTRDAWELPEEFDDVEDHLMDMFKVIRVGPGFLNVVHLFNDEHYEVTVHEKGVLEHLRRGQVFLMAIIRCADEWQVWWMSPPYSAHSF